MLLSKCTSLMRISWSFDRETSRENTLRSMSWLFRFPLWISGSYSDRSQITLMAAGEGQWGAFWSRNWKIVAFINIKSKFKISVPYQLKPNGQWGIMLCLHPWLLQEYFDNPNSKSTVAFMTNEARVNCSKGSNFVLNAKSFRNCITKKSLK